MKEQLSPSAAMQEQNKKNATRPKIVIEIRGGALQAVYANQDIEYVLIDYDEREVRAQHGQETFPCDASKADAIYPNLHEVFEEAEPEISEQLKKLNF